MTFCSASASKYHISSLNPYSLYTRIGARFVSFLFSCQQQTGIDAVFFVANMVNIIRSMQVLNMFNSCKDTRGPFVIPFITCSYKIVKASIGSRIFTQGSPHTQSCCRSSCRNCHIPINWNWCQKDLCGNCQKNVSCKWNISFSLSSPIFSVSRF